MKLKYWIPILYILICAAQAYASDISAKVCVQSTYSLKSNGDFTEDPAKSLTIGIYSDGLSVRLKNELKDAAIALRGVYWDGYPEDSRGWLVMRYGSLSISEDRKSAVQHEMHQSASGPFESGIILPAEERIVAVPMTPQPGGKAKLIVKYARLDNWKNEVLLPVETKPVFDEVTYSLVSDYTINKRAGKAEGYALVTSTCKPWTEPLPETRTELNIKLPIKPDSTTKLTGGLSVATAAAKAGLRPGNDEFFAFYRPALKAWFFVKPDGKAAAVVKQSGTWKKVAMPDMDIGAPDYFAYNNITKKDIARIILNPKVFGDIVKVNRPSEHSGWFNNSPNTLEEAIFWRVLERARQKNLRIQLVTYNPNGLDNNTDLVVGVTLDKKGRTPELTPTAE